MLGLENDPNAYNNLSALAAEVPPGADGLVFLPYLIGERSPVMDAQSSGAFIGLKLRHNRGHMVRAIMEGVAFSLRQVLDVMVLLGAPFDHVLASGNGLAQPFWRQIVADVFNRPLYLSSGGERAGIGAALIAGIGAGIYDSYADTRRAVPEASQRTEPDPMTARFYEAQYQQYLQVYPLLRSLLHNLY
jgi:xylulokinase